MFRELYELKGLDPAKKNTLILFGENESKRKMYNLIGSVLKCQFLF